MIPNNGNRLGIVLIVCAVAVVLALLASSDASARGHHDACQSCSDRDGCESCRHVQAQTGLPSGYDPHNSGPIKRTRLLVFGLTHPRQREACRQERLDSRVWDRVCR